MTHSMAYWNLLYHGSDVIFMVYGKLYHGIYVNLDGFGIFGVNSDAYSCEFINSLLFSKNNKTIIEFGSRRLWEIIKASVCVMP